MAGGKSRKSGQVSKKLIEKIQGKSCGRGSSNTGVTKGGLLDKGADLGLTNFRGMRRERSVRPRGENERILLCYYRTSVGYSIIGHIYSCRYSGV